MPKLEYYYRCRYPCAAKWQKDYSGFFKPTFSEDNPYCRCPACREWRRPYAYKWQSFPFDEQWVEIKYPQRE